ncbi:MAG: hypothetical protein IPF92_23000 [Myxococcales bacterium]|nr:hypothetical protein [Myxococcales bacterium]MBL0194709.1 hypothetical protein [Myxococcales bacterium]HQY63518.1 hypothetical protein [Polyangiaceae bacterium]
MRSPLPFAVLASAALAALGWSAPAHAEPSAWFSGGGGVAFQRNGELGGDLETRPAMSFAFGVGTTPAARATVGLGLRMTTFFSQGTDLAIAPRLSTGGFARGDFGLAVELGLALRTYKDGAYGRVPLQVVALFGAPFGLQLGLGAQSPSLDGGASGGLMALFEVDLLRLTVLRQGSSTRFWENPMPLGGAVKELSDERAAPPPRR